MTGIDDLGRSCVLREREVAPAKLVEGLHVDAIFRTRSSPPDPRPQGHGDLVDLGLRAGQCSLAVWRFEPGAEVGMHQTDSLDFDVVLEGAIDLILDDGAHPLSPGDAVVMTGVDHSWLAGAQGCILIATSVGSSPRD